MSGGEQRVVLRPSAELEATELAKLFAASWPGHGGLDWAAQQGHSLCWVSAHVDGALVGFVNVAGDGGEHAFLLDTVVHPGQRRRGIGRALVRCAADEARALGARWLHVDHAPELGSFYRGAGFAPTAAGLLDLSAPEAAPEARPFLLRRYQPGDASGCRAVFASLPDWFGIPSAVEAYLGDLPRLPAWVAVEAAGDAARVLGFIALARSAPRTFEVHVLAVDGSWHGRGAGSALLGLGERFARAQGARFMQLATLGPSRPDAFYERTRGFYQRLGYEPLLESDRFWEGAPALLLVKAL